MSLKAIVENLDGLSAELAKEYKKSDDGKYRLDVIAVDGLELAEVSKLQSALSKERENNRQAKSQLEEFADIDPTKAREALRKVSEMASWTPEQKVKEQIESIKAQLLDAHGKEKAKLETELKELNADLSEAKINSVALQELTEQGSVKKMNPLLLQYVKMNTRLRKVDGKNIVEVVGVDGNPRLSSDGSNMSIPQLVTEMKPLFPNAFEGNGASGSGASGGSGGGGSANANSLAELAKLPPAERLKKARELGIK